MVDDTALETSVRQALVYDRRISASAIQIVVNDGVVQLDGIVQSYRRAMAAYETALSVPGVRGVVNRMEVEPPVNVNDEETADHVRGLLNSDQEVVKEAITVSVAQGVVTLSGSVRDTWHRDIAEDVARRARGVRDVRNLLIENLTDLIDDAEASRDIQSELHRALGDPAANIRVAVSNRVVALSGSVPMASVKEDAERIACRFGLVSVCNDIRVASRL